MGKLRDTSHHEPRNYSMFGEPLRRSRRVCFSASPTAFMTLRGMTLRGMTLRGMTLRGTIRHGEVSGGFERRPGLVAAPRRDGFDLMVVCHV